MTHDPNSIRLLVLDVDGVMTDARIVMDDLGRELKFFDVRDGLAMRLWMKAGRELAVITGRSSPVVAHRAAELGVAHLIQASHDKGESLRRVLERTGLTADQAAVLADDLPDGPMLRMCGYPMAVADAVAEVRDAAAFVTQRPGGRGAVREAIEHLMKSQGLWSEAVARFEIG